MEFSNTIERVPATAEHVWNTMFHLYAEEYGGGIPIEKSNFKLSTTVREWQDECDLHEWEKLSVEFNENWEIDCSLDQWQKVLQPEKERTFSDVCQFIAKHATRPIAKPVTILGTSCTSAGMFFAIRSLLKKAGVDTSDIKPSTCLEPYVRKDPHDFIQVLQLNPEIMPRLEVETPIVDACAIAYGLGILVLIVLWILSYFFDDTFNDIAMLVASLVTIIPLLFTIFAAHFIKPKRMQFGNLETFRDLAMLLSEKSKD